MPTWEAGGQVKSASYQTAICYSKNRAVLILACQKVFSDTFGFRVVEITPDMVGQKIAQFVAIEVKTTKGAIRAEQSKFIDVVNKNGGCGSICRSAEDALTLIGG